MSMQDRCCGKYLGYPGVDACTNCPAPEQAEFLKTTLAEPETYRCCGDYMDYPGSPCHWCPREDEMRQRQIEAGRRPNEGYPTAEQKRFIEALQEGAVEARSSLKYDKDARSFVVKDSGEREKFDTGAHRDTRTGKGRFDLIPSSPLFRLAKVYEKGAEKYTAWNWHLGIPQSRCMDSALRHLHQAKMGDTDEDHLAHAVFNIMAIMTFQDEEREGDLNNV